MRTNLEKFKHYKSILKQQESDFIQQVIKDYPKKVYKVFPSGNIQELTIIGLTYSRSKNWYFEKRPSKIQVQEIKDFSESKREFDEKKILFNYGYEAGTFKASGAFSFYQLEEYFTKEGAEKKSKEVKDVKEHEEHLINNCNHVRCQRCSKVVPIENSVSSKIIFQDSRSDAFGRYKRFVNSRVMNFCSGTCASHEQMSREG